MPIASPAQFRQMLKAAQDGGYAYPAINTTSIMTLNAAMKGFAETQSDGIIQFSTGAGQFASGLANKDMPFGCIVLAVSNVGCNSIVKGNDVLRHHPDLTSEAL